jgi:hypothetical protein
MKRVKGSTTGRLTKTKILFLITIARDAYMNIDEHKYIKLGYSL